MTKWRIMIKLRIMTKLRINCSYVRIMLFSIKNMILFFFSVVAFIFIILAAVFLFVFLPTLLICCFCPVCYLAKRRQRGRVIAPASPRLPVNDPYTSPADFSYPAGKNKRVPKRKTCSQLKFS